MWSFLIEFMPHLGTIEKRAFQDVKTRKLYFSDYCPVRERGLFGANGTQVGDAISFAPCDVWVAAQSPFKEIKNGATYAAPS